MLLEGAHMCCLYNVGTSVTEFTLVAVILTHTTLLSETQGCSFSPLTQPNAAVCVWGCSVREHVYIIETLGPCFRFLLSLFFSLSHCLTP